MTATTAALKAALSALRQTLEVSRQMLMEMHSGFLITAKREMAIAVAGHAGLN